MSWAKQLLKYGIRRVMGVEPVDAATKEARLGVCRACPRYDAPADRCRVCGCFMDVKAGLKVYRNIPRTRYEITHCPEGRWGDRQLANEYRALDGLEPLV